MKTLIASVLLLASSASAAAGQEYDMIAVNSQTGSQQVWGSFPLKEICVEAIRLFNLTSKGDYVFFCRKAA